MSLIKLEKASQEDTDSMQGIVKEYWDETLSSMQEEGIIKEDSDTISFVTTDSVVVCGMDGSVIDLFLIRFPEEVETDE